MKIIDIIKPKFNPNQNTFIAFGLGILSILFSVLLIYFPTNWGHWAFRIVFQISIIGIIIPIYIMTKNDELKEAGLRFDKPFIYILISIGIAGLLLLQFWIENNALFSQFSKQSFEPASYIVVGNVYEVIFFVVFLRYSFEKAFGIIPAIILSALFYSLHHAGFQPEFLKLFIVGLVFISIFRIANHWLICFPFWWIGGTVDVLTKAENFSDLSGLDWWKSIFMLTIITASLLYFRIGTKKYKTDKIRE